MKSPDMNQYITLLFSLLTEFLTTQNPTPRRGRPRRYTDASLLVFHAAMALKGITALRAQHRWLVQHPQMRTVPLAGVSLARHTQPPVFSPGPAAA